MWKSVLKTVTVQKRAPFWFIIKKELSPCLSKRLHYPLACHAADNAASFTSGLSIFPPADNTAARSLAPVAQCIAAVYGNRVLGGRGGQCPVLRSVNGITKVNRQFGAYLG